MCYTPFLTDRCRADRITLERKLLSSDDYSGHGGCAFCAALLES